MLRHAEHLRRRFGDDRLGVDLPEVAQTLLLLSHLQRHLVEAVPAIHDLWSAERFARGFRFGQETSRGRHSLLKPLGAFTPEELAFETDLARRDLESIDRVIRTGHPGIAPARGDGSSSLSGVAPEPAQRLLVRLSGDHQFLLRAAPLVHQNWRQANAATDRQGDLHLHRPFQEMSPRAQRHTIGNLRIDLLALAVLVDRDG